jgi:hypothetical protein
MNALMQFGAAGATAWCAAHPMAELESPVGHRLRFRPAREGTGRLGVLAVLEVLLVGQTVWVPATYSLWLNEWQRLEPTTEAEARRMAEVYQGTATERLARSYLELLGEK